MKFLTMGAQHFKTYREPFEVPLEDLGTILVKGENRVSESSDSNGTGKSTLVVDLPSWILYGITPSGLRGDEVACRFTRDTCAGWMTIQDERGLWTIRRTRRPATLRVEGPNWDGEQMKDIQARIDQRLGRGFKTFKNTVLFGQGNFERFAQAEQSEQIRMLDEIQGVDFTRAAGRADAWRKELVARALEHRQSIARDEEAMGRLTRAVGQLEQAQHQFTAQQAKLIDDLKAQRAHETSARDQIHKALEDLMAQQDEVKNLRELWNGIQEAARDADFRRRTAEAAKANFQKESGNFDRVTDTVEQLIARGVCPSCRAEYDAAPESADARRIRAAYAKEIDGAQALRDAALDEWQRAEKAAAAAEKWAAKSRKAWRFEEFNESVVLRLEQAAGPKALETGQQEYRRLGAVIDAISRQIEGENRREWEGASALGSSREELGFVTQRLTATRRELERAERAARVAQYWVTAFGDRGIRSLLVDSVAGFLNDRLQQHLRLLAAGEVAVKISATTTLKSGKQKEDLSIVPAWAWGAQGAGMGSAGQDRRVELALFAALQDLAESRSAKRFPIKVWDEPGDALDATGKEMFCQWIAQEVRERGTGFLVTHSNELAAQVNADGTWTVVLDRDGSHVVME